MRLSKEFIRHLAKVIIADLNAGGTIAVSGDMSKVEQQLHSVIFDEVTVEDRINEEVRELLQRFEPEIKSGKMDYRRLFEMTKKKLVAEKGVIL